MAKSINRYLINDESSGLDKDADGGLAICIQNESLARSWNRMGFLPRGLFAIFIRLRLAWRSRAGWLRNLIKL